ncbi:twin-arginine translocase TatA/TatE family subunit [Alkaliphilus oremlandii]
MKRMVDVIMFGKLGTSELVLILGIALIIFGPGKLPELGKSLGKAISEFKSFSKEVKEDISLDDKKANNTLND